MNVNKIRKELFKMINDLSSEGPGYFQRGNILEETAKKLDIKGDKNLEQALLTVWNDLIRSGHIAWGCDLNNPDPPFVHITEKGREVLKNLSRDPANPDGYINYLVTNFNINDIALSYIKEAIKTYNNNCYKASAVMVGGATEKLILEIKNNLVSKIKDSDKNVPSKLQDWKIKTVTDGLTNFFNNQRLPRNLYELYSSHWSSFSGQIRMSRNKAGHPSIINPISEERVYASLLIFPELLNLVNELNEWIKVNYS